MTTTITPAISEKMTAAMAAAIAENMAAAIAENMAEKMTAATSVEWESQEDTTIPELAIQTRDWRLEFNISGSGTFDCPKVAAMWHARSIENKSELSMEELSELAEPMIQQLAEETVLPHIPTWEHALRHAKPPVQIKAPEDGYR